jgi:hypothetical protein
MGRCRSTNLCEYCARIAAVETTEMLWIDAMEQGSPTLWLLLTTSVPVWDGDRWKGSIEQVTRSVRKRWPEFEMATLIEFTTGYGPRSGGVRRAHGNCFVRGVPTEDADELQERVGRVWCPRMEARPEQQRVYLVDEDKGGMRGLTRYVAMHFLKADQAPPKGWRGQRFRATAGYFNRPRWELRRDARESLRVSRTLHRLLQAGRDVDELDAELARQRAMRFELVRLELDYDTGEITGITPVLTRDPETLRRRPVRHVAILATVEELEFLTSDRGYRAAIAAIEQARRAGEISRPRGPDAQLALFVSGAYTAHW